MTEALIRIRFPRESSAQLVFSDPHRGIEVTSDPKVIALEAEKNGPNQFALVESYVRPAFKKLWEADKEQLFQLILIETRSGCNYTCSFCPVSRHADPRPPSELSSELLNKLASELASIDYAGRIALFGNNEPLLDVRLTEIVKLFRTACPGSDLRVLSNGTYASIDRVLTLFEAGLSTLVINNYTDGCRLIAPVRTLLQNSERLLPFDIRISVRNRIELLTTRAGTAPNKSIPDSPPRGFCALPFTDLYVSSTGAVNLCSFDAYGTVAIGNVEEQSVFEIWRSGLLAAYRKSLLSSTRAGLSLCEKCDFDGFRTPELLSDLPLTRDELENLERT